MKRGMSQWLLAIVGVIFLGVVSSVSAEHAGGGPTGVGRRSADGQATLENTAYDGLIESLRKSDGSTITTTATIIGSEPVEQTVTEAQVAELINWSQGYRKFRSDLELCTTKEKDPSAQQLSVLMDAYSKALRWGLFSKVENVKGEAKENELVSLTDQIKLVLSKRAEKLGQTGFASEDEKKIAAWLDKTNGYLFGEDETAKARRSAFDLAVQRGTAGAIKESVQATDAMVAKFEAAQSADVCKVGGSSAAAVAGATATPGAAGTGNPVTPPAGAGKESQEEVVEGGEEEGPESIKELLAGIEAKFASQLANATRAAGDEARVAADTLARAQIEKQRLDAQVELNRDRGDDKVGAALAKALGQVGVAQATPPPPPSTPVIIPPTEQQLPQIAAQPFQPPLQQEQYPQGPMPMMMPPMPQPLPTPPVYTQGPSQFANNDFYPGAGSLLGGMGGLGMSAGLSTVNPVLAGQMAVNQLLQMVRNPQMMGQGGMNTLQNGYGNMNYGQQTPNTMTARIGLFGQSGQRNQMALATGGSVGSLAQPTSGPAGLAASPAGRSTILPSALQQPY